jgi:hypothetical protein
MERKKLIIGCFAISGIAVILTLIAGWLLYSLFTGRLFGYEPPETPNELREARVVIGAGILSRSQFIRIDHALSLSGAANAVGLIYDITIGELNSNPGLDIVVAGSKGVLVLDPNGAKQSQVQYQFETGKQSVGPFNTMKTYDFLGEMQIIDVEGDGTCEYLARGSIDGAAVFDHQGRRLWSYGKFTEEKTSIDVVAAGDIDGDGVDELVAVWDGVELFNRDGGRVWQQQWEGPIFQIEVVDTDGDGKAEIIQSGGGNLIIRDGRGGIVRESEMPFYFAYFSLCPMPGREQAQILTVEDGNIWLIGFDGKTAARLDAPLSRFDNYGRKTPLGERRGFDVYKAKGIWVKLIENQPEYLAVIAQFVGIDRSILYLYGADGKLVYQEILPEDCRSIAALPPAGGKGVQELLVGGDETIWRYKAR